MQEVEGVLQRVEVANERELEVLFDGMGWTSRIGSCRLGARTPQTKTDHNSTRYMRDSHFALGKDKNEELHKMAELGGEASLASRMRAGVKVTERDVSELPAHVQSDELFAPLARYECACICTCTVCSLRTCIVAFALCCMRAVWHAMRTRCRIACAHLFTFVHEPLSETLTHLTIIPNTQDRGLSRGPHRRR